MGRKKTGRPPGRPPQYEGQRLVAMRLDAPTVEALQGLAVEMSVSQAEVVRRAVRELVRMRARDGRKEGT